MRGNTGRHKIMIGYSAGIWLTLLLFSSQGFADRMQPVHRVMEHGLSGQSLRTFSNTGTLPANDMRPVASRTLDSLRWAVAQLSIRGSRASYQCSSVHIGQGLLLTAAHCVNSRRPLRAVFGNFTSGRDRVITVPTESRVLAQSARLDIALIRMRYVPRGITAIPVDHFAPSRGSAVILHHSNSRHQQISRCNFNSLDRYERIIFNCPIQGGASGSPILTSSGHLIGIATHSDGRRSSRGGMIDPGIMRRLVGGLAPHPTPSPTPRPPATIPAPPPPPQYNPPNQNNWDGDQQWRRPRYRGRNERRHRSRRYRRQRYQWRRDH